ncbi:hypothetical protein Agub_g7934 [Astrephomene gubernaculifera]|uniref:Uncharacterized protein n=1 Tax=Astrephomene gubernaculifera TaxID=47775 RepID=A0AAD3DQX9_9CHLO|nr:hypothetical protein Agub_g7934 [Astrephomene gubernaculifera]
MKPSCTPERSPLGGEQLHVELSRKRRRCSNASDVDPLKSKTVTLTVPASPADTRNFKGTTSWQEPAHKPGEPAISKIVALAIKLVLHNAKRCAPVLERLLKERPRAPGADLQDPSSLAAYITTIRAQGGKIKWRSEDEQIMYDYLTTLRPDDKVKTRHAMQMLGIAHLSGDDKLCNTLCAKLNSLRNKMKHGAVGSEPADEEDHPRRRAASVDYKGLLKRAYLALPGHKGTLAEAARVLEADPEVSPQLDRRLYRSSKRTPIWRQYLRNARSRCPQLVKTGEERGGDMVLRWHMEAEGTEEKEATQQQGEEREEEKKTKDQKKKNRKDDRKKKKAREGKADRRGST